MDSIDFGDRRKDKSGNKKEISPEQEEQVKQFIQDNLVEDLKEVQRYIQDEFNIFYKESTIIKLLHAMVNVRFSTRENSDMNKSDIEILA